MTDTTHTREQWLNECAAMIIAEVIKPAVESEWNPTAAKPLPEPPYRISVAPLKAKHLGECFPRSRSEDAHNEIFITAKEADSLEVLDTLVHELIHAYDDCKSGHKHFFAKIARAVGLDGKLTSTHAGPVLKAKLQEYVELFGPIPHAALTLVNKSRGRNNNKIVCNSCDFKANTSAKWVAMVSPGFECPACLSRNTDVITA